MPSPRVRIGLDAGALGRGVAAIRAELGVPTQYPVEAVAEARAASASGRLPREDATALPLVTIDPPGSRDLDQAVLLERRGAGYRVHYAIADPTSFVSPGGAMDLESRRRGATLYAPDSRVPLYPEELGEGAASLLPDVDRPAVLWQIDLDADALPTEVRVRRALVRSRQLLTYAEVQAALDDGTADEALTLLREVGRLREAREAQRGGVSLRLPTQEVIQVGDAYRLAFTAPLPVEGWNAQISLLTGQCAAELMIGGKLGLLRTLPPPDPDAVTVLRSAAGLLQVDWPAELDYPGFLRRLDPREPAHAALLTVAAQLLRGAGYVAFAGTLPDHPVHSAVAMPYAHVTAPLRRLADRFATEVVLAVAAGTEPPDWALAALPDLPAVMTGAAGRQRQLERAVLDYVEAAVLAGREGETFDAVVVGVDETGATVTLAEPAVRARVPGNGWPLGQVVQVRLAGADPVRRRIQLVRA